MKKCMGDLQNQLHTSKKYTRNFRRLNVTFKIQSMILSITVQNLHLDILRPSSHGEGDKRTLSAEVEKNRERVSKF